jgi:hypothetical protein
MSELISLQERRRQAADERLLAMLTPEQRDAVLWALRTYPTLTVVKAVEMLGALAEYKSGARPRPKKQPRGG